MIVNDGKDNLASLIATNYTTIKVGMGLMEQQHHKTN